MVSGASPDDRAANSLENVTKTIGNLLDGYDIRLRPNFGGKPFLFLLQLLHLVLSGTINTLKFSEFEEYILINKIHHVLLLQ